MAAVSLRFLELISRQRGGLLFDLARGGLLVLSMPYLAAVTLRNAMYDYMPGRVQRVDRPVISVGNITVGGSGKTPVARETLRLLRAAGVGAVTAGLFAGAARLFGLSRDAVLPGLLGRLIRRPGPRG